VEVKVQGKTVRFVNTHLEAFSVVVRNQQARELAAALAGSAPPVVLVGDLNSAPDDTAGAYGTFAAAGYVDAWVVVHGPEGGFTAGQSELLDNVPSKLDHRVDYVLYQPRGWRPWRPRCWARSWRTAPPPGCGRPTMPGWWPRCTWPHPCG
jgi:endonuclease/exonuclease/phosphatase family metal-dependent hydrolase